MSQRIQATNQSGYRFDATVGTPMESITKWKKYVAQQRIATRQKNTTIMDTSANNYVDDTVKRTGIRSNIFIPQPLKIQRKEIASVPIRGTASRSDMTIESLERPGATIQLTDRQLAAATHLDAIVLDQKQTHSSSVSNDHPGRCQSFTAGGVCLDPATNARRRCRSSGVMKPNYNSTSYQYLSNRNMTFQKNQYQFVQSGNTSTVPGTSGASQNIYRTQGSASSQAIYTPNGALSTCTAMSRPFTPVYYKPNNPTFARQGAVDSSSYILRRKFDSVTRSVAAFRPVYGNAVASAMGYGIADSVYTYKDKIGYPLKKTPVISPYKPTNNCCNVDLTNQRR